MEDNNIIRGGQFIVKETHYNDIFTLEDFFGRANHDA